MRGSAALAASLTLLAALGCSSSAPVAEHPEAPPAAKDCGSPSLLTAIPKPGRVLVLGGKRGTRELPRAVAALVCHASALGFPVVVGLDLPGAEQGALNAWMVSTGSPADQRALLSGATWATPIDKQDGRASRATLDLLEALRGHGKGVSVVALDAGLLGDRTTRMASTMSSAMSNDALGIALVSPSAAEWVPTEEPPGTFAWQLSEGLDVLSFRVNHGPGTRWGCTEDECGEINVKAHGGGSKASLALFAEVQAGFHGTLSLPESTASAPAVK